MNTRTIAALGISALAALPTVLAASQPANLPPPQRLSPEQEAARAFNDGLDYSKKADKLGAEAAEQADAAKKERLTKKSIEKYADAAEKYQKAIEKSPKLFQAWGGLGYAYRKSGKYQDALTAYDKALALEPGYTPAIEYRAEAYLELDRLDEVKDAYMILFQHDRPRADELDAAIQKWVEKRKTSPGTLDPSAVDSFSKWAAERHGVATRTSSLLAPSHAGW
jgi:tetratricopeptide (TPR) repeat protein